MTTLNDDDIRNFLADEARRALTAAPSLEQAVARVAGQVERPSAAPQRTVVLLAATLLLMAALGTALAVGSGLLRLPLVVDDHQDAGAMWPQTTLAEVEEAQQRADAGDPRYTWQVDPALQSGFAQPTDETEIVARFLRDELGWEAFRFSPIPEDGFGAGASYNNAYIRCAPGRTNPLYPDDPSACAPTMDDGRYERVSIDLGQLARQDASGIWVVTRWAMIEPFEQAAPPSAAETDELVEAFLQARVDGRGAEAYVDLHPDERMAGGVPLLYATPAGARYDRHEGYEIVEGPMWPDGQLRVNVRLVGGDDVVEQTFFIIRRAAGFRLEYRSRDLDAPPTTENGQPVPAEYTFLGGQLTFQAAWPWEVSRDAAEGSLGLDTNGQGTQVSLSVTADPKPVEAGCQQGPAPTNAAALARSIASDPDLDATAPLAVDVGGTDAVLLDITPAPGASVCQPSGAPQVTTGHIGLLGSERMRLYLVDVPGEPGRIVAFAFVADEPAFDQAVEISAPIVESVEFRSP